MSDLSFVLTDFEGPLDLLLHLIRTNKYDVLDIPIVEITHQFMDYLHGRKKLQLDVAGDYLVMAASLMSIKSRMLLPVEKVAFEDDEIELDPREDLVSQLLAYEAYQSAAGELAKLATDRQQYYAKPASEDPKQRIVPLAKGVLKPNDIFIALQRVLKQQQIKAPRNKTIVREEITIEEEIVHILTGLENNVDGEGILFEGLFTATSTIDRIVTTFLAVLELMKNGKIRCIQSDYLSPIRIQLKEQAA